MEKMEMFEMLMVNAFLTYSPKYMRNLLWKIW